MKKAYNYLKNKAEALHLRQRRQSPCRIRGIQPYNPVLMRFTGVDPLASKYPAISPFAYCGNNPVNAVDPDGRSPLSIMRAYKAYKSYRAYRATRTATVTMGATDAAMIGTAATATTAYTYNYFLSLEQAEKAQQSLLKGISDIANQNAAVSPEYNNQRKQDRDAKQKLDKQQANVQQTVINGGHNPQDSGGDFKPNKPDPKAGLKVAAIATAAGVIIEQVTADGNSKEKVQELQ